MQWNTLRIFNEFSHRWNYKFKKQVFCVLIGAILGCTIYSGVLAIPTQISYTGSIKIEGELYSGIATTYFSMIDDPTNPSTNYWTNDGSSPNFGERPNDGIEVTVDNGTFKLNLGDTNLTNMTYINDTVFKNDPVYLRVWYCAGIESTQQITPDNRLISVPYALNAHMLDGEHGAFYQDASNLTSGILPSSRLTGMYSFASVDHSNYASIAADANMLNNQVASFYQNANNMLYGYLSSERLAGSYPSATTGYAIESDTAKRIKHSIGYRLVETDSGGDYNKIQDAISDLHTHGGGVVYVQAGWYYETITTYHGIDIVGVPKGNSFPVILSKGTNVIASNIESIYFYANTDFVGNCFSQITQSPKIKNCLFLFDTTAYYGIQTGIHITGGVGIFEDTRIVVVSQSFPLNGIVADNSALWLDRCQLQVYGYSSINNTAIIRGVYLACTTRPNNTTHIRNSYFDIAGYHGMNNLYETDPVGISACIYSISTNLAIECQQNTFVMDAEGTGQGNYALICLDSLNEIDISHNTFFVDRCNEPLGSSMIQSNIYLIGNNHFTKILSGCPLMTRIVGNAYWVNNDSTKNIGHFGVSSTYTYMMTDPIVTPSLVAYGSSTIEGKTYTQVTGADYAINAGHAITADTAVYISSTNLNADSLDGQHGAFYQNASSLNAGIVSSERLIGTYCSASTNLIYGSAINAKPYNMLTTAYSEYTGNGWAYAWFPIDYLGLKNGDIVTVGGRGKKSATGYGYPGLILHREDWSWGTPFLFLGSDTIYNQNQLVYSVITISGAETSKLWIEIYHYPQNSTGFSYAKDLFLYRGSTPFIAPDNDWAVFNNVYAKGTSITSCLSVASTIGINTSGTNNQFEMEKSGEIYIEQNANKSLSNDTTWQTILTVPINNYGGAVVEAFVRTGGTTNGENYYGVYYAKWIIKKIYNGALVATQVDSSSATEVGCQTNFRYSTSGSGVASNFLVQVSKNSSDTGFQTHSTFRIMGCNIGQISY